MKITLYKNCILNDNYNEVFDLMERTVDGVKSSVFTDYLTSLDKTEIDLPNTYYSRNMSFTLRIEGNDKSKGALDYNYCKFEADGIVRYCFITDIELANTVATYYTEEDIWSNYAGDMQIRRGFLSQSRKIKYGEKNIDIYQLPFDYQSVSKIEYRNAGLIGGSYSIIMQLQIYQLGSAGNKTKRFTKTILLAQDSIKRITPVVGSQYYEHDIQELDVSSYNAADLLNKVVLNAGSLEVLPPNDWYKWYESKSNCYYEVNNITIIPNSFMRNIIDYSKIDRTTDDVTMYFIEKYNSSSTDITIADKNGIKVSDYPEGTGTWLIAIDFKKALYGIDESFVKILQSSSTNINFKTVSFGTRTSQFEVICVNENSLLTYNIETYVDDYNFKLFLNFQSKWIEITNDFMLDMPFDTIDGSIQAQRRLNRIMETTNGASQIGGGVAQVISNAQGINARSRLQTTKKQTTEWEYGESKRGKKIPLSKTTTVQSKPYKRKQGDTQGIVGGAIKISSGVLGIFEANSPVYVSNSGTFATSMAFLNATEGLVKGVVAPSNTVYINKMIDEVGYTVYEFTKDNDFIFNNYFNDYNVLLFTDVILYGKFPGDIKEALEEILLSGFKIWYNAQLEENPNADI